MESCLRKQTFSRAVPVGWALRLTRFIVGLWRKNDFPFRMKIQKCRGYFPQSLATGRWLARIWTQGVLTSGLIPFIAVCMQGNTLGTTLMKFQHNPIQTGPSDTSLKSWPSLLRPRGSISRPQRSAWAHSDFQTN